MNDLTDQQLLTEYQKHRSEPAFAELARRHVDLVYSAALRMVCDAHLARDVTQSVFIALAKSAPNLTNCPVLSGWLHKTARNLAANVVRSETRRRAREQEAAAMNELLSTQSEASWQAVAPHLDAALGELNDADRDALMLRYFEKKSAAEMAGILGISAEAAQKRVARAVERLRELFSKRDVTIGAGGLVVLISANAVQSAPAGLATAISAAAVTTTAGTIALTKTVAMTTLQKTLAVAAIAILAGAAVYESHHAQPPQQDQPLQQRMVALDGQAQGSIREGDNQTNGLPASQILNQGRQTNAAALAGSESGRQNATSIETSGQPLPDSLSATNLEAKSFELPRNSWTNSGFATPEAALKTRGWAVLTGDREVFAQSVSITPGARKMMEDMLVQMASASTDPNRDQLIQQAINNKWGAEEAILMPIMALNQQQGFAGYRILSEQSPAADQLILNVETEMTTGSPQTDALKLQRIDGNWKVVIDEDLLKTMH